MCVPTMISFCPAIIAWTHEDGSAIGGLPGICWESGSIIHGLPSHAERTSNRFTEDSRFFMRMDRGSRLAVGPRRRNLCPGWNRGWKQITTTERRATLRSTGTRLHLAATSNPGTVVTAGVTIELSWLRVAVGPAK